MTSPVSQKYDLVAKLYDWTLVDYTHTTLKHAIKLAQLSGSEKILDIGCGTGPLELKLSQRFPQIAIDGCDISPGMIAQAQQKIGAQKNIRLHVGDFTTMPFELNSYDTVFALSDLHYFPNPQALLKHAWELAKPGASFILVDWLKGSVRSQLYEHWMQRVDRGFQKIYTLEEMKTLLASAGWHYESHVEFGIRGCWTMLALRARKP